MELSAPAEEARSRLEQTLGLDLGGLDEAALADSPDPNQAWLNLERWLQATTSPKLYADWMLEAPDRSATLMLLLGASQPLADCLIQNPELASLLMDQEALLAVPEPEELLSEGLGLLEHAQHTEHALDRIRFLRQKWMLVVTVNDLEGTWAQPVVWRALSNLAEVVVQLTVEAIWPGFCRDRGLTGQCPLGVVAFGKLGGHELNYSSDIDLAFFAPDDQDDFVSSYGPRFCELLTRSLSDPMGRGQLYRVDLRLRPYGAAGPILNKFEAIEGYYKLYAEPWEYQALLRSRVIVGSGADRYRWSNLVSTHAFPIQLSEISLDQMRELWDRTEDGAAANDLKRGPGGIRTVEFLVQAMQMSHGRKNSAVQVAPTLEAIDELEHAGLLDHPVARALSEGYEFLRKLEHRTQMAAENQTHSLPDDPHRQVSLARAMGFKSFEELARVLAAHRRTIQTLSKALLGTPDAGEQSNLREQILGRLSPHSAAAAQWLDSLPEAEEFYRSLGENAASSDRVRQILLVAPRLVHYFKNSVSLTEMLLSGEIEEDFNGSASVAALPVSAPLNKVAETYTHAWVRACTLWALNPNFDLSERLTSLIDETVRHIAGRLCAEFDVLALGSFARYEFSLDSDADMVLLVDSESLQTAAEGHAQDVLAFASRMYALGAPIKLDLRLRPDGSKGMLVRTYEGLKNYDLEGMEMWERFAIGQARLVRGDERALATAHRVGYGLPLTPERLKELTAMKKRIENERVPAQLRKRDIKLGYGGLGDLEWFVHLHEMRYPNATKASEFSKMPARIAQLLRCGLINAVECEELTAAHKWLVELRLTFQLLGLQNPEIVPENPNRLDLLASMYGEEDGNAFLRKHDRLTDTVRQIYLEGLLRLKA